MNTKLMFAALGLGLIATSCSQEEVVSMNPDNAIAFRASTTSSTRGVESTTNNLTEFKVYAYHTLDNAEVAKPFMDGVTVSKSGESWGYTNTQYWPNEGTLDFYSYAPLQYTTLVDGNESTVDVPYSDKGFGTFTVNSDVTKQIDLLYALNKNLSKTESPVNVNFRHALSQIVFKSKLTDDCKLTVKVDGVSICKVANTSPGFTFPTTTTSPNYSTNGTIVTNVGSWATPTGSVDFMAGVSSRTMEKGSTEAVELTNSNGALFLLPQTLKAWDASAEGVGVPANQDNAYFLVKCSLQDTAGNYIWGTASETKEVAIPLSATWKIGKKYVYTFIFGDGAGYNPNPGPGDNPKPDPVLVPITFTVTVDDFMPGQTGSSDVTIENDGNKDNNTSGGED